MPDVNPATPAQAATPGITVPGSTNPNSGIPPVVTPPAPAEKGTVTISTTEYAELQRAKARASSAQRRADLSKRGAQANDQTIDPNDTVAVELARLRSENADKDRQIMRGEVTRKVSDLLSKPEYADLPETAKRLIIKNPSSLSNAETAEEALLDIEDYLREEMILLGGGNAGNRNAAPAPVAPKAETPPAPGSGAAPAPADAGALEDLTRLPISERPFAAMRNAAKKKQLGIG